MAVKPETRKLLLNSITLNARAKRDTERTLDNLICRAVKSGITQTSVAKAAGVSQAHISRTVAENRQRLADQKAARAAKKAKGRESV